MTEVQSLEPFQNGLNQTIRRGDIFLNLQYTNPIACVVRHHDGVSFDPLTNKFHSYWGRIFYVVVDKKHPQLTNGVFVPTVYKSYNKIHNNIFKIENADELVKHGVDARLIPTVHKVVQQVHQNKFGTVKYKNG